jgi:outer membrane protein
MTGSWRGQHAQRSGASSRLGARFARVDGDGRAAVGSVILCSSSGSQNHEMVLRASLADGAAGASRRRAGTPRRAAGLVAALCVILAPAVARASQTPDETTRADGRTPAPAPRVITLDDALALARKYSPELQAAAAASGAAHAARLEARSALLPGLTALSSYFYTQPDSTGAPRYIASNGIREYVDQVHVRQQFGVSEAAGFRGAVAAEELARAGAEIAARGLVVIVVERYDTAVVSERNQATAQQAVQDAGAFLDITRKREAGGEAAHADVIKAQIVLEQRQRELREAQLALRTSRNDLAILISPTYETDFVVVDRLMTPAPLPPIDVVRAGAAQHNPAIAAAEAALRQAHQDVLVARGQLLPSLAADYFYGMDASRFALSTDGVRHLGSSVVLSVNVPLWNWGASKARIAASSLRERQARVDLTFAQRQLLSDFDSLYAEAQTARAQLDSLTRSVDLAADSLRLATLRYQRGEATVLEVVDAQATLAGARYDSASGQARYHVALARLQTLTGSL